MDLPRCGPGRLRAFTTLFAAASSICKHGHGQHPGYAFAQHVGKCYTIQQLCAGRCCHATVVLSARACAHPAPERCSNCTSPCLRSSCRAHTQRHTPPPFHIVADFIMQGGAVRNLLAFSSSSCGNGFWRAARGTTATPPPGQVQYSALSSLGWDVYATRPSSTSSPALATPYSTDIYSVLCNTWGSVDATTRRQCLSGSNSQLLGEIHVRYDCTSMTFWVLAFLYSDRFMGPGTPPALWAMVSV